MVQGQLNIHMKKNKIGLTAYTVFAKLQSHWIKDLNITAKIIKLLEESRNLCDPGLGNHLFYVTQKAQVTNANTDESDFMKVEILVSQKITSRK